jgi:hypothetical protein
MAEVITELQTSLIGPGNHEYYVQVVGEQLATGRWEVWLEFVPLDDNLDVLVTKVETTQQTPGDVLHWSATLTDVYLKTAFAGALSAGSISGVARTYSSTVGAAPLDPFDVLRLGADILRAKLRPLSRGELLATIDNFGLNPAQKSLARLSDSQLVTFIVTAVEVQALQGRR